MFLGSRARPVRKTNLTAICEILDVSQPYRPLRPVTGIVLLFTVLLAILILSICKEPRLKPHKQLVNQKYAQF
jgi:hypothetical protein